MNEDTSKSFLFCFGKNFTSHKISHLDNPKQNNMIEKNVSAITATQKLSVSKQNFSMYLNDLKCCKDYTSFDISIHLKRAVNKLHLVIVIISRTKLKTYILCY